MGSAKKKKRLVVAADKPTPDHQHQPVTSRINYYLALLLILATALLYGHSLWNPLVFDDAGAFFDANLERLGSSLFHLDLRWFPYATFGWTYKLFGLDWFWYRLGNLGLHALTTVLLFVFFSRLLDATVPPQAGVPQPRWPAFFAALVFALHPAAVYGVAYLVQRSILMATLFGIAALLCYMEGLTRNKARWFVLSALCYFLAVFSKEHSIMVPGVAAALTLLLHKPSFALIRRVWLPFALYLVIGMLIILRTKGLLGAAYEPSAAAMFSQLNDRQQEIDIEHAYGLSVITQGYLFFKYLLLWIVPYTGWMSVDIRQPFATHFLSWPESAGFILFMAYPVLAIKLLLKGGRQGLLGFGLLFPWILYLTELSTVRIQEPFVLYRSYLWMSGLPIVLFGFMGAVPRKFVPVLLAACCLVLAGLAWNRLDTFSSGLKLWSDAIAKNKNEKLLGTERIYNGRGNAYKGLGRIPEALADYEKAIALNPEYLEGYNNRGNAYEALGRIPEALADYEKVIALNPKDPEGYKNSGYMYYLQNNYEEALHRYNTAIGLAPDYVNAYTNRGVLLQVMGRHAEAFSDYDRTVQLAPRNPLSYSNRASANFFLDKFQEALDDYDKILSLDAKDNQALLNRRFALNMLNRKNEAMESFRKSCNAGNTGACKQLH